jgi:hypothetical protein
LSGCPSVTDSEEKLKSPFTERLLQGVDDDAKA